MDWHSLFVGHTQSFHKISSGGIWASTRKEKNGTYSHSSKTLMCFFSIKCAVRITITVKGDDS